MKRKETSQRGPKTPVIFDMTAEQCVWARAGLAQPRLCHNAFDCLSCSYDRQVQRDLGRDRLLDRQGQGVPSWQAALLRQSDSAQERLCRHALSGRAPAKRCPNAFDCGQCEFDQMLEQESIARAPARPQAQVLAGFELAENYYYHPGHAWARLEYGGRVRVGMDDFAARLLGPLEAISLPGLGQKVTAGAQETSLFRLGQAAGLPCPVSGQVLAVNPALAKHPGLVHADPHGQGWLFLVQPSRLQADLHRLAFGPQAQDWLEAEVLRLHETLHGPQELPLAATGGRALEDIFGSLPGLDWAQLARQFLLN